MNEMKKPLVNILWLRRDLRLRDHAALYHALKSDRPVLPIFIYDRHILDKLENRQDRRLSFIYHALDAMQQELVTMGSSLAVYHGYPVEVFDKLLQQFDIGAVFTNHDYEPYAIERDALVGRLLSGAGVLMYTYKDQVIFEKNEVLKDDGKPYTVFTPYSRKWKTVLNDFYLRSYPDSVLYDRFYRQEAMALPSLSHIGFEWRGNDFPSKTWDLARMQQYGATRDFPAMDKGTSRLGVHLRFGTISIRELARAAKATSEVYLNELIWRDFYHAILWHFPQVGKGGAFKPEYDRIVWRNNEEEFTRWCQGLTGYPLVDAGMRELNATGYMHNRLRMITASFLCKHLLTDWRWGEAYFATQLLDFDLAANNGGWQWASSSGCDAAPYFRIFNPALQAEKFDKAQQYIEKWVPERNGFQYPPPIEQHELARQRALAAYALALK